MTGSNRRPSACKADALPAELILHIGDPYGNRTRDTAVKGRCLNRLTNGPVADGGEQGIRTLETVLTVYTISNRAPSAARTALLMAPKVGLEPTTNRLTVDCSTTELLRNDTSLATFYSHKGRPLTTIDAEELNCRVRDGNGCDLFANVTRQI
jgi:hypothetical protein